MPSMSGSEMTHSESKHNPFFQHFAQFLATCLKRTSLSPYALKAFDRSEIPFALRQDLIVGFCLMRH